MSDTSAYTALNVWVWDKENGGQFASINQPIAGATHVKELPVGRHPLQLYSMGTPNGVKVERAARSTGERLAALGVHVEISIYLRDGTRASRFVCAPAAA
jgi:hypothetical protein